MPHMQRVQTSQTNEQGLTKLMWPIKVTANVLRVCPLQEKATVSADRYPTDQGEGRHGR